MARNKLGLGILTALVVGNMVGSGIFMLPSSLAEVASPGGTILAWVFTGVGVLFLALVFGHLALHKPELKGGPQIYAKALFKEGTNASILSGYTVSWGYWVANFAGNVAIITSFAGYLSTFFPILNSSYVVFQIGPKPLTAGHIFTFSVCSLLLWMIHFLILKGVEGAGKVNFVATAAKLIGFLLFIIATLFAFQTSNIIPFVEPVESNGQSYGLLGQLHQAALITLWAFAGVESAVVFAGRAKRLNDVKRATILGLLIATFLYIAITILVMGTMNPEELAGSSKPLVDALVIAIGDAGGYLLAALAVLSLFGSTVGWVMLTAEVPHQSAKQGLFLKVFAQENKNGTPVKSLWISNIATQVLIFSTVFNSISGAFDFVMKIATLAYLLPYLVAAIYQVKLSREEKNTGALTIGILASLYAAYVVVAGTADMATFLWGVFFLAIGLVLYPFVIKNNPNRLE